MKKEYRCVTRTKKMIRASFAELLGEKKNMEAITVGELDSTAEYESYIAKVIEFLKANEAIYRKAILSSDIRFFIEKLKSIISKRSLKRANHFRFQKTKLKNTYKSASLPMPVSIQWSIISRIPLIYHLMRLEM